MLPLIYNGNIDIITKKIEELKVKYKNHINFLNSFLENNLGYFISGELNYNKFPKIVRSNSILENYNGVVKRELGKKKKLIL